MKINNEQLNLIYKKTPTAETMMVALAMRTRFRPYTNLLSFRRKLTQLGEKLVIEDYERFWKDLETLKVGKLVYSKHGSLRGFSWYYNFIDLAKGALQMPSHEPVIAPVHHIIPHLREATVVFVPLRTDYDFVVKVPTNLTHVEKEQILNAIKKAV